jgi:hypothetical protein
MHHSTPASLSTNEVLRHAALYLRQFGWCQRVDYSPAGDLSPAASVIGAVISAVTGRPDDLADLYDSPDLTTIVDALTQIAVYLNDTDNLADQAPLPADASLSALLIWLDRWNDRPYRTETHVLHALNAAAQRRHRHALAGVA